MKVLSPKEAKEICEELFRLAQHNPGSDPGALGKAQSLIFKLQHDERAEGYVGEKISAVFNSFELWFSPRRWNKGGDGGAAAKTNLHQDIWKLRKACDRAFSEESDA